MTDADFTRLKIVTERELGRDLQPDEEHTLKALFYFGKGVKLKNQLAGPERIGPIAERALAEIAQRRKVVLQRGVLQRYRRRRKLSRSEDNHGAESEPQKAEEQRMGFMKEKQGF